MKCAWPLAALAMVAACAGPPSHAAAEGLGLRVWRAIAQQHPTDTVIASPAGLETALKLLAAGAAGATRAELKAALGDGGLPGELAATDAGPDVTIGFGACLWSPPTLHFAREFAQVAIRDYAAVTMTTAVQAAPAAINAWAKQATRGLVSSVIQDPPGEGGLVLANAVAFKGKWAVPFDPALTASAPFTTSDRRQITVPMMSRSGRFRHASTVGGQLIDLPYGGGRYGLTIFLAETPDGLASWIERADLAAWRGMVAQLAEDVGELRLPRLDLTFGVDARAVLAALGIGAAFRPQEADFTSMTEERASIYIEKVHLRIALKLDESGTQAAATAVIQMAPTAVPGAPFKMVVDRPFFFALHGPTPDRLLLVGAVRSP